MRSWVCERCRAANTVDDRACAACGTSPSDAPRTWPGGAAAEPAFEPFFRLEQAPRWPALRRVLRVWPVVVFLVVLLFFAVAGLQR